MALKKQTPVNILLNKTIRTNQGFVLCVTGWTRESHSAALILVNVPIKASPF